ncbi:response regulator [Candidatus Peribacteria bacterium]|nr:response regulator [Candidatus Peribacteria bacterium]
MDKFNIVIAEDDAVLREVYQKKFTLSGYDIRIAQNGEEAVALITQKAPDFAILDVHMPVLDGFGVLRKFPRASRSFPVIMLTNYDEESNKKLGNELGADDYFVKSEMTIKSLLTMVETLLKAKRMWST